MSLYLVKYFQRDDVDFKEETYKYVVAADIPRAVTALGDVMVSAVQLISDNPLIATVDKLH